MKVHQFLPSDVLKPFVNRFLVTESEEDLTRQLLPGTAPVMALRFKGAIHLNDTNLGFGITGISRVARPVHYTAGSAVLLVLFKEGGAAAFINMPLNEFSGLTANLDNVFPPEQVQRLEENLDRAQTHAQRIVMVENFLITQLKTNDKDPIISISILLKSASVRRQAFLLNTSPPSSGSNPSSALTSRIKTLPQFLWKPVSLIRPISTGISRYLQAKALVSSLKKAYQSGEFRKPIKLDFVQFSVSRAA